MSLQTLIRERRTIRDVDGAPISPETLMELLETASFAPFHSKKEPWHVTIIESKEEKEFFYQRVMESFERLQTFGDCTEEERAAKMEKYKTLLCQPSMLLLISSEWEESPKRQHDAFGAVSAFIQNFHLAAWEREIGVVWRTNPYLFDSNFAASVGLPEDHKLVGTLHVGYPKSTPPQKKRQSVQDWTKRLSDRVKV